MKLWVHKDTPNRVISELNHHSIEFSFLVPGGVEEFVDYVLIPVKGSEDGGDWTFRYKEYDRWDKEVNFLFYDKSTNHIIDETILNSPCGIHIVLHEVPIMDWIDDWVLTDEEEYDSEIMEVEFEESIYYDRFSSIYKKLYWLTKSISKH